MASSAAVRAEQHSIRKVGSPLRAALPHPPSFLLCGTSSDLEKTSSAGGMTGGHFAILFKLLKLSSGVTDLQGQIVET